MSTKVWIKRAAVLTARKLRREQTEAESVIWKALRGKNLGGAKFCRQHPIAITIDGRETFVVVDFCCHSRGLVVEVDGSIHLGQKTADCVRTIALQGDALRIIRFSNGEVLGDLDLVLTEIRRHLRLQDPPSV
jgi:very-short-patch-repair endonuclease